MIDIHSHILFDTDDGSKSIEESVAMIKEAYNSGFTTICATPHYLEPNFVKTKSENEETLSKLKEALKEQCIPVDLYLGNEIYITHKMEKLIESKTVSTMGNSDYILFELPLYNKLESAVEIIRSLPYDHIIMAHPERYHEVQKNLSYLDEFIEMGVLLQCNYESILGKYGLAAKKTMKKLLKRRMVDMLGTDTHKPNSIYTRIEEANKKILKITKDDYFKELTYTVPKEILGLE